MNAPEQTPANRRGKPLAEQLRTAPEATHGSQDTDTGAGSAGGAHAGKASTAGSSGRGKSRTRRGRGEIWPGCPVKPLGVSGECSFYLDALGQLRAVDNHTAQKILHVFGDRLGLLCEQFPQNDQQGNARPGRFDQTKASMAMIAACSELGVWSPANRVRGAGAWADEDGAMIYHAGNEVFIDGEWQEPGVYDGRVYPAAEPVPRPAAAIDGDPAAELLDHLDSWAWRRRGIDPQLALGLVCAQMVGGALEWRPVAWLTGDAATGKSTFQRTLLYLHGGEAGLLQAADATEAGIRSLVGYSSLPVAIDELEPDKDNPKKVSAVIELARRAASGAKIFRGSSDQKGHQSNAYSCFLFSSILVPPMRAQDRQRLIKLDLERIASDAPRLDFQPKKLRRIGARLRRALIDRWTSWPSRLDAWRAALAEVGQTGRAADNYATVLALADLALSEAMPSAEVLKTWASQVNLEETEESVDTGSNAEDMLFHLMGQLFDPFRRGSRHTVAQWVMAAAQLPGAPAGLVGDAADDMGYRADKANQELGKYGLKVRGKSHDAELLIANKLMPGLNELFRDTDWAEGVWSQAARRLEGSKATSVRFANLSSRAWSIPLVALPGLFEFPSRGTGPPSTPGVAPSHEDFM